MKLMKKYISAFLLRLFVFCIVVGVGSITAEAATAGFGEVMIKSASHDRKKEQITVKWEPVKRAAGYQFAYKRAAERKYTVRNVAKTSQTFSVCSAGIYKIKVRAYKNIKFNGKTKTCYGKWSGVKLEKICPQISAPVILHPRINNLYKRTRLKEKIIIHSRCGAFSVYFRGQRAKLPCLHLQFMTIESLISAGNDPSGCKADIW